MSRKLVAFFSAGGVTRGVAQTLADTLGAELYEIKPAVPYTQGDLDWTDKKSRSTVEMNDLSFRPAIADNNANVCDCDVIFVGFPIWWYIAPTIINTFLESYDFSGKTIVPFATSGGSDMGKTVEKLKTSLPKNAIINNGKLLSKNETKASLTAWVSSLGL